MKRFVFRLQTLLEHRENIERMRLGELARLRRQEQLELVKIGELTKAREKSWEAIAALAVSGASSWDLANADDHSKRLGDDIKLHHLTLAAARRAAEAKLAEVVAAARERRILEQLRDKQRREYELAAARLEQKELEDVASVRYARGAA